MRRLDVGTDMSLRGEWDDRSGQRTAGGVALVGGLVLALTLVGAGAGVASSASTTCSPTLLGCTDASTGSWIAFGIAAGVVGLVATIVGTYLLALNDRPRLTQRRLAPRLVSWIAPLADGAMLGVAGEL